MAPGFLLALEGIDGSGTTTQAARLVAHLERRGRHAHHTAEPTRGPIGKLIRSALGDAGALGDEPLALLFAADRLDHLEREIEPALAAGGVVVSDRYLLSSLAYQGSYLPLDLVLAVNSRARRPDASILLRVSADTAARRRAARGGDAERFDDLERQRAIAAAYDRAFALPGVGATYVVDAEPPAEDVGSALEQLVDSLIV